MRFFWVCVFPQKERMAVFRLNGISTHLAKTASSQWYNVGLRSVRQTTTSVRDHEEPPKPYSSIPQPKGLPFIGMTLDFMKYMRKQPNTAHIYNDELLKKYGPIMRIKLGSFQCVFLSNPGDIKIALKHEGKYPVRVPFKPWMFYREERGHSMAVLLSEGEEWQKNRTALNYHMMRPHNVALHIGDFNDVAKDFMDYLAKELKVTGNGQVRNLRQCLFLWSLEAGSTVIYEKRLGCLSESPPVDVKMFIDGIQGAFATSEQLFIFPPKLAKALGLSMWKEHAKHWDNVYKAGLEIAGDRIKQVKTDLAAGKEVTGLISSMLRGGTLTDKDVISNIIDLTGGALDTTSLCSMFTLHLLARNPEKQQNLFEEIQNVKGDVGYVGMKEIQRMPFMKAVIKESLRLFPVVPFNSRITETDTIISGYSIPKGTTLNIPLWTIGRDPDIYPDPESFRPERWLRDGDELDKIHPFAHLNFGHGPRACIGRRVAELEMYTLFSQILHKYEIQDGTNGDDLATEARMLLLPKGDVNIIFKERNVS